TVLHGVAGSGRTVLLDFAAAAAAGRGIRVVRTSATGASDSTNPIGWARVIRDAGGHEDDVAALVAGPSPLELDAICARLLALGPQLIAIDDIDRDGDRALEVLRVIQSRAAANSSAVIVTSTAPLGVGTELALGPLDEPDIRLLGAGLPDDVSHGVWAASRGNAAAAASMLAHVAQLAPGVDPIVALALGLERPTEVLDVDPATVALVELALTRTDNAIDRSVLLAALAYQLMGDTSTLARRQELIAAAEELARAAGDDCALARVLDARLHALWDP